MGGKDYTVQMITKKLRYRAEKGSIEKEERSMKVKES